ncbi:MAG: hypothetical protein V5A66_05920, partial [Candidatus Thermoplasmatota archaeon]
IGLNLEHYTPPNGNPTSSASDGDSGDHTHISDTESGTVEYNMWRIANTSDGKYYYSEDGSNLEDIFAQIGDYLSGPQNISSVGDPTPLGNSSDELTAEIKENFDKYAVTPELDLSNTSSAWLTFWQKYRLLQGVNGGYLEIGYENQTTGETDWRYIKPSIGPYTGNLLEGEQVTDSFGNNIEWAWNGQSAGGTMDWERVKIDLLRDDYNIPEDALDTVRIRFYYKQFGGSTVPGGWWIDDVKVEVTRSGDWWDEDIDGDMHDVWQLRNTTDMEGEETTAWWNGDYGEERCKPGIDNSLITDPIDMRNAQSVTLNAEFKFNINGEPGLPPDGFRVEVSEDEGKSWSSINLGGRAATGVSGDGDSNYWTTADELTRLNIDLSDYSGEIILLRFRVVTNNDDGYDNYEDNTVGFGGFYINDVMIVNEELRN